MDVMATACRFLPINDPLEQLPKEFLLWDQLGADLPKLLLSDQFRQIFDESAVLATDNLPDAGLERAMMLLSFFGHAYVWGDTIPATSIPASIAKPWYEVAKRLGRPPVLSYASYALNNWQRLDPKRNIELGNIRLLQNFLGGLDEEWFVLVHVDIENKASTALKQFLPTQEAIANNNMQVVLENLAIIQESLEKMCATLDRMTENCDPYIYYHRVRPYIHGWKDNPALPQGITYQGVAAFDNKPQRFRGETGAQSSIIPAFDALLGITHHPDPLRVYLMEMRDYMPVPHRKFIETVEDNGSIREFVINNHKNIPGLRDIYNDCINLITRFRQIHLKYAAQYIQKQSQTSLANPTQTGTGGTPFMDYLKKHKEESSQFLILA